VHRGIHARRKRLSAPADDPADYALRLTPLAFFYERRVVFRLLAKRGARRLTMADKRDPLAENDEIGNPNEEIVGTSDEEDFEDLEDEEDFDEEEDIEE
jgi:hypothetical protein